MLRGTIVPKVKYSQVSCPFAKCSTRGLLLIARQDLHIYQAGVALQQIFILVFVAASIKFHRTFAKESPQAKRAQAHLLLYTVYAVLALITVCLSPSARGILGLQNAANSRLSCEFCSALPNTPKVSKARFRAMRRTSTVWTRSQCSSLWFCSMLSIQERSWPVKRAIFLAGRRGKTCRCTLTQIMV